MRSIIAIPGFAWIWLAAAAPLAAEVEEGETREGAAEVVSASTLRVDGTLLRLYGITAPLEGERCPLNGRRIDCGHIAATQLMDLTAGATVTCEIRNAEADPPTARCLSGNYDLSEGMVYTGWARPLVFAPDDLKQAQETARERGNGLWKGDFPASVKAVAHKP